MGTEGIETEAFDDERCERCQSRVGNLCADSHDEEDPRFWIFDRLPCLIGLEMVIFDSLAVRCYAGNGDDTFGRREEFGCGRKIREKNKGDYAPEDGDGSEDQEDVHPFWETGGDVSDSVADETAKHGCDAVSTVVGFKAKGLLSGGVPHGHQEDKSRVYGCFDGAEEESIGCYAAKRDACWSCDEDYSPCDSG